MTQDEIIRMAREAGFHIENWSFGERVSVYESGKTIDITNELKDFASLVAAHEREKHLNLANEVAWSVALAEREACAKVCEQVGQDWNYHGIAAAIRARSENGTA